MNRSLICGLCISFGIFGTARADAVPDATGALLVLANAARIDDYGKYDEFLKTLGFIYSNIRSSEITESATTPASIIGTRVDMDVAASAKTELARGAKKAEYGSFLPRRKHVARVIFWAELDTHAVCIKEDRFVAAFAPLRTVLATDAGPTHLEREFPGANHRGIAAYFSEAGCANKIFFTQMPE